MLLLCFCFHIIKILAQLLSELIVQTRRYSIGFNIATSDQHIIILRLKNKYSLFQDFVEKRQVCFICFLLFHVFFPFLYFVSPFTAIIKPSMSA